MVGQFRSVLQGKPEVFGSVQFSNNAEQRFDCLTASRQLAHMLTIEATQTERVDERLTHDDDVSRPPRPSWNRLKPGFHPIQRKQCKNRHCFYPCVLAVASAASVAYFSCIMTAYVRGPDWSMGRPVTVRSGMASCLHWQEGNLHRKSEPSHVAGCRRSSCTHTEADRPADKQRNEETGKEGDRQKYVQKHEHAARFSERGETTNDVHNEDYKNNSVHTFTFCYCERPYTHHSLIINHPCITRAPTFRPTTFNTASSADMCKRRQQAASSKRRPWV